MDSQLSTSESVDDYLKAILELGGAEDARVCTNALAERLGVRTPSVTGMLQKLAGQDPTPVHYEKHKGVRLTAEGKRRAWELVRHHRLLELFLHDVLKYSWDEVHDEAERLEHFISERFEDRVAAILGNPTVDPHGHAIPQKYEAGVFRNDAPLTQWPALEPAIITSVSDRDSEVLRELDRLGIKPGIAVTVEAKAAEKSLSVKLQNGAEPVLLTTDLADCIFVAAELAEDRQLPEAPSTGNCSVSDSRGK